MNLEQISPKLWKKFIAWSREMNLEEMEEDFSEFLSIIAKDPDFLEYVKPGIELEVLEDLTRFMASQSGLSADAMKMYSDVYEEMKRKMTQAKAQIKEAKMEKLGITDQAIADSMPEPPGTQ